MNIGFRFVYVGLKFVYIDFESAILVQGDVGIDSCPEGYETITEPSTCQTASESLGLKYIADLNTDTTNAICNWCGGCSPQSTSVGDDHGPQARWICKGTDLQCLVLLNLTI